MKASSTGSQNTLQGFSFKLFEGDDLGWVMHKTIILEIEDSLKQDKACFSKFIFENTNPNATEMPFVIRINHNYTTHYFKTFPKINDVESNIKSPDFISKAGFFALESMKKQGSGIIHEDNPLFDRWIIMRFDEPKSLNKEKKSQLAEFISKLNYQLLFSEHGFKNHFKERLDRLVYAIFKAFIHDLSSVYYIDSYQSTKVIISRIMEFPNNKEILLNTINDPQFKKKLEHIVYKTIISEGLYPAYVEINTMDPNIIDKSKYWLQNALSNYMSSPWGSQYHTSFLLGHTRYNYANDTEYFNGNTRLMIRQFKKRQLASEYDFFHLKLFDFFPKDEWIQDIASVLMESMEIFPIIYDYFERFQSGLMYNKIMDVLYAEKYNWINISNTIVNDFWKTYGQFIFTEKIYKGLTDSIEENEFIGYNPAINNCQTMVSDIVYILVESYRQYVEPLKPVNDKLLELIYGEKKFESIKDEAKNKFVIDKDNKLEYECTLQYKLDYFGTYTDLQTKQMFARENIGKLGDVIIDRQFLAKVDSLASKKLGIVLDKIEEFKEKPIKRSINLAFAKDLFSLKSLKVENQKEENSDLNSSYMDNSDSNNPDFGILYMLHGLYNQIKFLLGAIKSLKKSFDEYEKTGGRLNQTAKKKFKYLIAHKPKWLADKIEYLMEILNKDKFTQNDLGELIDVQLKSKYISNAVLQELNIHYFNSVRVAMLTKPNNLISYIGVLFVRNEKIIGE